MTQPICSAGQDDHEVLRHFFARGGSIRMLADITQGDIDKLYAYATQLFHTGDMHAARNVYSLLVRIDHWNFECWLALGLCNQRLGLHEEAVSSFGRAGMINVDDPRSAYFAGISHSLLGQIECARKAFNAAIKWCNQQPEHEVIQHSAAQLLAHCAVEVSA
ncbi:MULTISPECIES: SycD/LcrH family type III secretion system chaperone [Pseudomonas]|uniref:CesD/SycD/LcrH family type III secretion system chaperone n=1 Tax=Pseudomonas chlororaphis TaxID=587753 RepID=A0AB34BZG4_9PSED|nr:MULTISPECIES: SycD/LcrH family type III secretion system chaperone [Pseudomonas]KAA5839265.1 CesD/SycD/LcrH family type III secretion system chaperone [Pseudomonas chlororaphis]PMY30939.1 CesD/SycD/LcrH family type III secretion system chaperone [Pseudomonas sp. GW456-L14]PMY48358.1 CesD/SycD/LcrH family type III secretion system chaperone [Pseudomonas sp. GW456-L12]PMY64425.1 CesD/SycD/LcrH family type III secretion system chaperone [Pseudomonas sp. FW305-25]PMY68304.1 CesD/SycD/LcrH famil